VPYFFKEKPAGPAGEVQLSFYKDGALIRSFASGGEKPPLKAEAGANRFVWDMRYPDPEVLEGAVFQGSRRGPVAPPGKYEVELSAGGSSFRRPFEIARDPRLEFTDADLQEQFDFLIAVRDKLSETMRVVSRIREMRKTAEQEVERAGGSEALKDALRELNDKLYPLEERLVQYRARAGQDLINYPTGIDSKLARLSSFASMGDGPPTQGARSLFARLSQGVAERSRALDEIERGELQSLLRLAGENR
jgi:hypothetical protein